MKKLLLAAASALLLCPLAATAATAHMNPGKWEVTSEMDMPGMPMKMPTHTFTHCVSKEQADKPEPPRGPRENDCKVSDYAIEGNVVTYKMTCEKSNTTVVGKMTFGLDSYEVVNHMKMGEREMTQKMTGKRIGDCDAK